MYIFRWDWSIHFFFLLSLSGLVSVILFSYKELGEMIFFYSLEQFKNCLFIELFTARTQWHILITQRSLLLVSQCISFQIFPLPVYTCVYMNRYIINQVRSLHILFCKLLFSANNLHHFNKLSSHRIPHMYIIFSQLTPKWPLQLVYPKHNPIQNKALIASDYCEKESFSNNYICLKTEMAAL